MEAGLDHICSLPRSCTDCACALLHPGLQATAFARTAIDYGRGVDLAFPTLACLHE